MIGKPPATGARVTLCYEDPEGAYSFYIERCGFERVGVCHPPDGARADTTTKADRVVTWDRVEIRIFGQDAVPATSPLGRRLARPAGGRAGAGTVRGAGVRIELPVPAGISLQDFFVRLERAGVDIVEPPGEWWPGEKSFTISDPGQYLVAFWELCEPRRAGEPPRHS